MILGNSLQFFRTVKIGTPPDGCFWDYLGKQSWRFSVPQMQSPGNIRIAFQKNLRKLSGKNLRWCVFFLILATKTLYYGWFPGDFKCFRTTISRNSFGRLLLEGFFSRKQSPESVRKAAPKSLRNFWRKHLLGYIFFYF